MTKKESNVKDLKKSPKKVTKNINTNWPKVVKGTHLTVTTYENGKTELVWDDAALLKEVQDATMQYELSQKKPAVRAKATTRLKRIK